MDLRGFDALITTCPLNIRPHNLPTFVQTIHDLIPLEFVAHNEDPSMFSHRLQACIPARKLFVSQSTATKYNIHIQNAQLTTSRQKRHLSDNDYQRVIVQSPSLHFPNWLTEDEHRVADLQPASHLLRAEKSKNSAESPFTRHKSSKAKDKKSVKPFSYFLFNSSVEARKNLLFLAQAYTQWVSTKKELILLLVNSKRMSTAKPKRSSPMSRNNPHRYVDESSKLDLYLNGLDCSAPP